MDLVVMNLILIFIAVIGWAGFISLIFSLSTLTKDVDLRQDMKRRKP